MRSRRGWVDPVEEPELYFQTTFPKNPWFPAHIGKRKRFRVWERQGVPDIISIPGFSFGSFYAPFGIIRRAHFYRQVFQEAKSYEELTSLRAELSRDYNFHPLMRRRLLKVWAKAWQEMPDVLYRAEDHSFCLRITKMKSPEEAAAIRSDLAATKRLSPRTVENLLHNLSNYERALMKAN